jgi:hypothetical protein
MVGDIDRIATQVKRYFNLGCTLVLWLMRLYLDYLGIKDPKKLIMVRGTIETIELTMEKERKEKEKEFKKNFDLVKLESSSWTIDVPVRKNK